MTRTRRYQAPITVAQIRKIETLVRKVREIAPAGHPRATNDQMAEGSANLRYLTSAEAGERIDALLERIAEFENVETPDA